MAKKQREWKVEEKKISPFTKILVSAVVAFIPFCLFILIPYLVKNHIVSKMNLSEELILAPPEHVSLVATGDVPATMKVVIHGFTFHIPKIYTPVRVMPDIAVFRINARRISRTISIAARKRQPMLSLQDSGLIQWFMPSEPLDFLDTILYATYHPVRLLCKAHFFASEGISSKVFETAWDTNHRAYIFPTSGGSGYVGRIYRTDGDGYYEFSVADEVEAVTLREWVDIAMKLKPPESYVPQVESQGNGWASITQTIARANSGDSGLTEAIEASLNRYYATMNRGWLIPIAIAMEKRGYYNELIQFYRSNIAWARQQPKQLAVWNEIFERTLTQVLKIEVDPHLAQNQVNLYCKNISDFAIRRVVLEIMLSGKEGNRSFETLVLDNDTLLPGVEKMFAIEPPPNRFMRSTKSITARVLDLEISD